MRCAKLARLTTSADASLPRHAVLHDDGGAVDDGGHPGAADEVDVEVRAILVGASASYLCCSRRSPPPSFLCVLSVEQRADNVLENENCRDTNVVNRAIFSLISWSLYIGRLQPS